MTLHTFCGCGTPVSGYNPGASLFQGTDGNFYSTTLNGGMSKENFGTVFRLSKGLNTLVETVPVAGKVGKQVIILGNHLTGTTGEFHDQVRHLHPGDGSSGREHRDCFGRDRKWNSQQQSTICGDEVIVANGPGAGPVL
jgi:uncharacterized repeat protein (TIGR03803 family)